MKKIKSRRKHTNGIDEEKVAKQKLTGKGINENTMMTKIFH